MMFPSNSKDKQSNHDTILIAMHNLLVFFFTFFFVLVLQEMEEDRKPPKNIKISECHIFIN